MNHEIDMRLIYEWNRVHAKLEFAIKECEFQHAHAQKRLIELENDLKVYSALLVVPIILYLVFSALISFLYGHHVSIGNYMVAMIFDIVNHVMVCLYIVLLPGNLYYLTKTILLVNQNKKDENVGTSLPPIKGSVHGYKPLEEPSFRAEYERLNCILTRYYINLEKMDELLQQIKSPTCSMNLEELKCELEKFPIYEDIAPSNTFSGRMSKKAGKKAKFLFIGFVLLMILASIGLCF